MRAKVHAWPAPPPVSAVPACHDHVSVQAPDGARRVVLVGNPNVGKSLFFNAFTGLYVDVSNFPGTTVAVSSGRMGDDVVLDTPGIYGVSSFNDEEIVARDIVTSGNTSAATIPLALSRMVERGEIPSGAPVLLLGFGSGLAYAAQVVLAP